VSYYLDFAQSIKKDNPEAAAVIEELYAAKVELEKTVKRISDARDLLLKEEDQQKPEYTKGATSTPWIIDEPDAAKVELEKTVKQISDARDLLLKEEDPQERAYIDGMADAHRVMSKFGADPYF
jgi:hypothetical protein